MFIFIYIIIIIRVNVFPIMEIKVLLAIDHIRTEKILNVLEVVPRNKLLLELIPVPLIKFFQFPDMCRKFDRS